MIFTIIVPIYNVEKYLDECINSVMKQSYKNIELILVNDGSTDNSMNICETYSRKDKRIKIINKKNAGLSAARNDGIDIANGNYILFLDGDDYFKGDFLGDIYNLIKNNHMPDIVFGDSINYVFPNGKLKEERYGFKSSFLNGLHGKEALKYIFSQTDANAWSACTNIYKKDFLKENKLFFKNGILFEDAEWTPRVVLASKSIVLYEKSFYMYRQGRTGSIMNTCSKKKIIDYLEVVKRWIDYSYTIDDQELAMIIKSKYCNNFVHYLKYLYNFEIEFVQQIINTIKAYSILEYVTSEYGINIVEKINKNDYDKVLKKLNYRYRTRERIKKLAIKLKLKSV